jgi:hypothetical protein
MELSKQSQISKRLEATGVKENRQPVKTLKVKKINDKQ